MTHLSWAMVALIFSVVIDQSNCQCAGDQCPKDVFHPNLAVSPDKECYDLGNSVSLTCSGNMGGPDTNTCNNGPFQGWVIPTATTCEVFTCSQPTTTDTALNFSPDKSQYDAREQLTYSCSQGYTLIGTGSTVCDSHDTWNPATVPTCTASCDAPNIANGELTSDGPFTEGSTATVQCDAGYGLESGSSSSITCQNDGTWNDVPQCFQNCNVTVVGNSDADFFTTIGHGGSKTITCDSGYSYNQQTSMTFACDSGYLDNTVPAQCYGDCGSPRAPAHGGVSGGNLHGETITFTCNQGYLLNETDSYTCNEGTWENGNEILGYIPTCYITETHTTTLPPDPAENVILRCGSSSFQVDIPRQLIDGTHYPSDFYLSGDPNTLTCRGFDNGPMYISLNSSLTECGTQLNDNGTHILFKNMVEINPSDGNSVVDFLGVEIPITCEYKSSEKLQTHFETIPDVIRKKAKGSFEFDFAMYTDITFTVRYNSYPVDMRLNEEMYFRAELLRSASNLEIHLRSCRATPSPDFDDAVVYEFIRAGCGINDSPVRVLTPNQPTQADFEITSFRFRADLSHPESQVWVHCEVVVCDISDTNSECRQGCEQSRHRRSVEGPPLKVERIVQGPIVFKGEVREETETLLRTESDKGFRGIFSTILSAVSLVMLIGLIVMGVTLRQVIRNSTLAGYQPVPNPPGPTTA